MPQTLYAYDKATGKISYTIDNPNPQQLSNLKSRGICGHIDSSGLSIVGTYVTVNTVTQETTGIAKVSTIEDYIVCTDTEVVANGTHEVVVSNLKVGTAIIIHDSKGDANQISTNSKENVIKYTIHEYGHHPKTYHLPIVEE